MATLSNEEIDVLKAQPKTEFEKTYEDNRHDIMKIIKYLSSLETKHALNETYFLIYKRLTIFLRSFKPEAREKVTPETKKIAKITTKRQIARACKLLNEKVILSPAHRTIVNHFVEAFETFNFACYILATPLENTVEANHKAKSAIALSLHLSLECLYKGDMRLIRESADPDRKQIAKNASAEQSKHYTRAQAQTCILLRELAPKDGWASKPEAAKGIEPALKEYLTRKGITAPSQVTEGNVKRRIRDWLDKVAYIETAYIENCAKTEV